VSNECFSLFLGDSTCNNCKMSQRCRSVFLSSGVEVVAGALVDMINKLPDHKYLDTNRVPKMLDQILNPTPATATSNLTELQKEMLDAMGGDD